MHIQRAGFHKTLVAAALAVCTATLSLPAAAQINFEVAASNFRYTVTDLKPEDGQAAAFYGNLRSLTSYAQGSVQHEDAIIFSDAQQSRSIRSKPPSIIWEDRLSAESRYAFDANENVTGHFVSGALTIPGDMQGRVDTSAGSANIFFELAPYSEVTMSLDVLMQMYTPHGSEATGSAFVRQWAQADGEDLVAATVSGSVGLWQGSFTELVDRAETLSIGIANTSDQWMYGAFGFDVRANIAQGVVTAVPEAPVPAMLAGGLGLLGVLGRRRTCARK